MVMVRLPDVLLDILLDGGVVLLRGRDIPRLQILSELSKILLELLIVVDALILIVEKIAAEYSGNRHRISLQTNASPLTLSAEPGQNLTDVRASSEHRRHQIVQVEGHVCCPNVSFKPTGNKAFP